MVIPLRVNSDHFQECRISDRRSWHFYRQIKNFRGDRPGALAGAFTNHKKQGWAGGVDAGVVVVDLAGHVGDWGGYRLAQ